MNSNRFIANFWNATTILGPWEYENPDADSKELDEFAMKTARLWWRVETVDGMDPASFKKLSDAERQELTELKRKFQGTFDGGGTESVRKMEARDALVQMYKLIGKFVTSLETITVAKVLTEIIRDKKYSGWFLGFSMVFENDWTGDPAIWVILIVDDKLGSDPIFRRDYSKIHQLIHEELSSKGVGERSVIMSVRTNGEQERQLEIEQRQGVAA